MSYGSDIGFFQRCWIVLRAARPDVAGLMAEIECRLAGVVAEHYEFGGPQAAPEVNELTELLGTEKPKADDGTPPITPV